MNGKSLCLIASAFLATACSDPRYVEPAGRGPGEQVRSAAAERAEMPVSGTALWLSWESFPTEEEFGSFILKFGRANRADGSAIPSDIDGQIEVVLWMPSMGHGSSPVTVEKVDVGTYRASEVFFTMPGDWEIRVQRKSGGNILEQAVFQIRL